MTGPAVRLAPRAAGRSGRHDLALALASLQKIESVQARWVLPGHGLPWQGSPRQAVKLARQAEVWRGTGSRRTALTRRLQALA